MDFETERRVAVEAAKEAGRIMQKYREDGFELDRKKAYNDIVTDADIACQNAIVEVLREEFRDDKFLGEENALTPDDRSGRVWVIDPIDGTRNFVHGFPFYAVSIALEVDGDKKVGAVYAPLFDELFTAIAGQGAERDGVPISVSDTAEMRDALVIARLSDYTESIHNEEHDLLRLLMQNDASFRRTGCVSLDLCQIACGRADANALYTIQEWDIAAGSLILEEAGGSIDIREADVEPYLEYVASNGALHEKMGELFEQARDNSHLSES